MRVGLPLNVYRQGTFMHLPGVVNQTLWTVLLAYGLQSVQKASQQLNVCLHNCTKLNHAFY